MKLCVLDNDVLDPAVVDAYTSYAAMFVRLLREAGFEATIDIFNTVQGHYPASFDDYDAVLLTGSRADSFSAEPWVQVLRQHVTQLLQAKKKLIGVCFGHQLIALCLGAKVGRAPQGWGTGRMTYRWHQSDFFQAPAQAPQPPRTEIALLASHQDQVFELPAGATLLASNDFCPVAAFAVGQQVLCVQPHPEFLASYSAYLLESRRAQLGEARYNQSYQSLAQAHDGLFMAGVMRAFLEGAPASVGASL